MAMVNEILLIFLLLFSCFSQETQNAESALQHRDKQDLAYPGENSYFPLIQGSYWLYEYFTHHLWQPSTKTRFTVDTLFPIKNGYEIRMIKQIDTLAPVSFSYLTDTLGRVYEVLRCFDCKGEKDFFTLLFPSKGDSIPKWAGDPPILTYQNDCNADPDCALFETVDLRDNNKWYARKFKKGVGEVYSGYSFDEECMVEYRIGYTGKIKHYYKLTDTSGVMYYTLPDSNRKK